MTTDVAGARWWKFDFHTHTPFSQDTPWSRLIGTAEELSPEAWLRRYMDAGVDCVAITDHNGGAWVDRLKQAYAQLVIAQPEGFRELHIFPGVELTVNGGVHLLAIFDKGASTSDIDRLLGSVEYRGTRGDSNDCTARSAVEVAERVVEAGGIAIPAHVDCPGKGLLRTVKGDGDARPKAGLDSHTLKQVLLSPNIFAMEIVVRDAELPSQYAECKCSWTRVIGSDCHNFRTEPLPGSRFTWVKMGRPSLEGLRLALLDGAPLSIRRSEEESGDPNDRHGELVVEAIEIDRAQFAGRGGPLTARFSRWLSALIGGRGSGKSTIIQLLRWVFGPGDELPDSVRADFENFARPHEEERGIGALTPATRVSVTLRRGKSRLRITRALDPAAPRVEEFIDDAWRPAEQGILKTLPLRILAQKEILELATAPEKLPALLDRAPEIGFASWRAEWESLTAKYLRLCGQAREIRTRLTDRARIKGELHEVRRQLAVFEEGGHRMLLVGFQRVQRQQAVFAQRIRELEGLESRLRDAVRPSPPARAVPPEFDDKLEGDRAALALLAEAAEFQTMQQREVAALGDAARAFREQWGSRVDASVWRAQAKRIEEAYSALIERLRAEGVQDPGAHATLLQRKERLEVQDSELDTLEKGLAPIEAEAKSAVDALRTHRSALTRRRREHVAKALAGNEFVRIEVMAYGDDPSVEEPHFRRYVGKDGTTYKSDILDGGEGLLAGLYRGLPDDGTRDEILDRRCEEVRELLVSVAAGKTTSALGRPFQKHLQALTPEQRDHLRMWWPRDTVVVRYRRRTDKDEWVDLRAGSKGQKSVAVLAFLLASGEEPIVLDQPEDDLDNHVIYDLVVQRIRDQKPHRQVIVATHNPNIVVNGDAEMVLAMDFRNGQCVLVTAETGCLQEQGVREGICRIMEGGKEAFRQRYERIGRVVTGEELA